MTDPLDDLKKALKAQQPAPREEARAAALRAAAEAFAEKNASAAQGTADELRPTQDRPDGRAGFWTGVLTMFSNLTQPRILMGTSALATVAIAVAITQNLPLGGSSISPSDLTGEVREAPAPRPVAAERADADGARRGADQKSRVVGPGSVCSSSSITLPKGSRP